jgi:hypothetical protein
MQVFLRVVLLVLIASNAPYISTYGSRSNEHHFKIRAITAGVNLKSTRDVAPIEGAVAFLQQAKKKFVDAGYDVQSLRITTQPLSNYLAGRTRDEALEDLKALDDAVAAQKVGLNIGPIIVDNRHDTEFGRWAARLINETSRINFSVRVASPTSAHDKTALSAAEAMVEIAKSSAGGRGNFRFTAAANCPPGIPFFPAGYHEGPPDFSIGLETPSLLKEAFEKLKASTTPGSNSKRCSNPNSHQLKNWRPKSAALSIVRTWA